MFAIGFCVCFLLLMAGHHQLQRPNKTESLKDDGYQVLTDLMDELTDNRSNYEKSLYLRKILSQTNRDFALDLLTLSDEKADFGPRHLIRTELLGRLATFDPSSALAKCGDYPWKERKELSEIVLREWASLNLENFLDLIPSLVGFEQKLALKVLVQTHGDSLPKLKEIATSLEQSEYVTDLLENVALTQADVNPNSSWSIITSDSRPNYIQLDSLKTVAIGWIEKEGFSVLYEMVESLEDWRVQNEILKNTLLDTKRSDPFEALQFALNLPNHNRYSTILFQLATNASHSNPLEAIKLVEDVNDNAFRERLYRALFSLWSAKDPNQVLNNIDSIPSHAREIAISGAVFQLATKDPEIAAQWVSEIPDSSKGDVGFSIVTHWSQIDLLSTVDWILTEDFDQYTRDYLLEFVWEDLVELQPLEAFELAQSQPSKVHEIAPEVDVIANIVKSDVDQAISLLKHVREGVSQTAARIEIGIQLIQTDQFKRAIELGGELSSTGQMNYFESVIANWATEKPITLYDAIEQMPSPEIQSRAAVWLVRTHEARQALTEDELKHIQSLISELDIQEAEYFLPNE